MSEPADRRTYKELSAIADLYQLSGAEKEVLFGISVRSQSRYRPETVLSAVIADRLARFERLTDLAVLVFSNDLDAARTWLRTSKISLENKTPLSVMSIDAGAQQVEQLLNRARYVVYQ